MNKITQLLSLVLLTGSSVLAQDIPEFANWYNQGLKGLGMSTDEAYNTILKDKVSQTVIVAIIDSGMDSIHEDLQGQLWINEDEIPGNGIDDDKNGYIDDVNGWSFLGKTGGESINQENLEMVRLYRSGIVRFEDVSVYDVKSSDVADYLIYKEVKVKVDQEIAAANEVINQYSAVAMELKSMEDFFVEVFEMESFDVSILDEKKDDIDSLSGQVYAYLGRGYTSEVILNYVESKINSLKYHYNLDFNPRSIVGDDPSNIKDKYYGTVDSQGPDALHGTHVGGIVGALRGNGLGGDGVASNVKLMSVRAVPDGDERDKDIALAIMYAVDNGAQVINMSFGKGYSAYPEMVYDAIKYAEKKGVLLINAAGNDATNIDEVVSYPTPKYHFQSKPFTNLLTIGASTQYMDRISASFSNYGMLVDIFAPGFEIYNTVPYGDKYQTLQGTSMAAPMVAGVAALLKSYYPELSMIQVKEIILASGTDFSNKMVLKPGVRYSPNVTENDMVSFSTLCTSGKVVNVLEACKMAEKMVAKS
jgi:cell wall-associated protease